MTHPAHIINFRVYYEDTDAMNVVYHGNYLRFAERGRTELLREAGFTHGELMAKEGIAFAVVSMQIEYKAPARLDDLLALTSKITRVGNASMDMEQILTRDGQPICDMQVKLVCVGKDMKSARLPDGVRALFKNL